MRRMKRGGRGVGEVVVVSGEADLESGVEVVVGKLGIGEEVGVEEGGTRELVQQVEEVSTVVDQTCKLVVSLEEVLERVCDSDIELVEKGKRLEVEAVSENRDEATELVRDPVVSKLVDADHELLDSLRLLVAVADPVSELDKVTMVVHELQLVAPSTVVDAVFVPLSELEVCERLVLLNVAVILDEEHD